MILVVSTIIALIVTLVSCYPTPDTVGSDLTFLFQNDLNWPTAPDHNGTILLGSYTHAQAIAACGQLSEGLLATNGSYFKEDITNILQYLALETLGVTRQYWVESTVPWECQAVSLIGGVLPVLCDEVLPTFCSQSAPYRPNTDTDLSPAYYVQVTSGNLQVLGTRDHLSFRFIGIPYANQPERFTYSTVYNGSGNISALEYGSPCQQISYGSEDCLFLNIYTPYLPSSSSPPSKLRPVMLLIHGGGFTNGEGSDGTYDGGNQASRSDVVAVTINYRLSTLGFLALEDGVTNGNYALSDMITALQWVQEHIADFGGDPSRVTIYGQSAGASAVRALLAAPLAYPYFVAAILESNPDGFGIANGYSNYFTIAEEYAIAAEPLISYVGCSGSSDILSCLRNVSAAELVAAPTVPRFIVVDGTYITTDQLELNGTGPSANVPVLLGMMHDDGADFVGSYPTANTTLAEAIEGIGISSNLTDAIIASGLFPVPRGTNETLDVFNVTSRVATDGLFKCLGQATVAAAIKNNIFMSVWTYQFDRSYGGLEFFPGICDPPVEEGYPYGDPNLPYFRCHGGEIYYVFGTFGQSALPFRDWNDLFLEQVVPDAWTSFVRDYNPNPSLAYLLARGYINTTYALEVYGPWQEVTPENGTPIRVLDVPMTQVPYAEERQCDVLGYPLSYYY